jgi:geranylgeranyl diphosphate synthase type I
MGGEEKEESALPAAAAIELYHTFTLVHDDIIDQDTLRRGVPTVHEAFRQQALEQLGYSEAMARHYGLSLGILAGDVLQSWSSALFTQLYRDFQVDPALSLELINELFRRVQSILIEGEAEDLRLSQAPLESVSPEAVLAMLWKKTGVLYEFAGRAGAAIGLGSRDIYAEAVESVAQFTGKCGTAFQIQDDILGLIGDQKQLGKPVGSDIREGKRTLMVLHSFPQMSPAEATLARQTLGNRQAGPEQIAELTALIRHYGGVDYARNLAEQYLKEALSYLDPLPESEYKGLLRAWAHYMIEREF